MDDVRAVMDTVSSKRAAVMGFSEGCTMSALFAATYPERVSRLILFGGFAVAAMLSNDMEERIAQRVKLWGTGAMIKTAWPSQATNPDAIAQFAKFERLSASPGAIKAISLLNAQIDVRPILPSVQAPTLVLHVRGDAQVPVELGRNLAAQIPNAKFIEYPGIDHAFWFGDTEALLGDIEEFVTGHREGYATELERILATVLFTDIVNSTRSAAQLGDRRWRQLLDNHDQLARQMIDTHRGTLVKTHRRRNSRDIRWTRPRGPLRVVIWRSRPANRFAAARGAPHRRDRTARPRYRRYNRSRRRPGDGAIRRKRSSGLPRCH